MGAPRVVSKAGGVGDVTFAHTVYRSKNALLNRAPVGSACFTLSS